MPLGFLRRLLMSTGHTDLQPEDARAAIAADLVMAARADHHYDDREQAMIDSVLAKRFGLTPDVSDDARLAAALRSFTR